MDLIEFLRARLDEDQAAAQAALVEWQKDAEIAGINGEELPSYGWWDVPPASYEHAKRWDPARVLAEVAAKRAVLHLCAESIEVTGWDHAPDWAWNTTRALATPFADHADFAPA